MGQLPIGDNGSKSPPALTGNAGRWSEAETGRRYRQRPQLDNLDFLLLDDLGYLPQGTEEKEGNERA